MKSRKSIRCCTLAYGEHVQPTSQAALHSIASTVVRKDPSQLHYADIDLCRSETPSPVETKIIYTKSVMDHSYEIGVQESKGDVGLIPGLE
jgi:hypothetical protein